MITYEISEDRKYLTLVADYETRKFLSYEKYKNPEWFGSSESENDVLFSLMINSDLFWVKPEESGDLTDAPLIGIYNSDGKLIERWGYMNYQIKSFLDDFITAGEAVFES